ncbi:MAG: hypothetical protein JW795_15390 [Chitinivibrionales bacterium]|nr:hypothetical protein [Chitinivibrionales bacterium]
MKKMFLAACLSAAVMTVAAEAYATVQVPIEMPDITVENSGDVTEFTGGEMVAKWSSSQFGGVDWATHASASSAQDMLTSANTSKIGNKYPAFVFCGSCSNATITTASNLTYSILKNCGIGAIGGTNYTFYGGSYLTSGSDNGWCYKFGKHLIADKLEISDALTELRQLDPNYQWRNRTPYVLYGDPSLGIGTSSGGTGIESLESTRLPATAALSYTMVNNATVKFTATSSVSQIRIYSLHGSEIATLQLYSGSRQTNWNRTDKSGAYIGSGMYVATIHLSTGSGSRGYGNQDCIETGRQLLDDLNTNHRGYEARYSNRVKG